MNLLRACELIYHFAWDELCDWYLELAKESFAGQNKATSQRVLGHVLDQLLRLMHPVMPFITEELWTTLTGGESLVIAQWPVANQSYIDKSAAKIVTQVQEIVTEVRRFRNDQGIKPSQKLPAKFSVAQDIAAYVPAMAFILRLEESTSGFNSGAVVEFSSGKVELDLTGTVDVVAERARLTKDLATAQKDRATAEVKLNNEGFMAKAPADVVAEIRQRLEQTDGDIARITSQIAALPAQ
jgi:valyl-tRNA synthetase